MTTTATQEPAPEPQATDQPPSWEDITVQCANYMVGLAQHRRGDLADLRRMDPDRPNSPAFWRLMARHELLDTGPDIEQRWGLIIHGLALMTPNQAADSQPTSAHNGRIPVGQALFLGAAPFRNQPFISESRLNHLLNARGRALRLQLARTFRNLGKEQAALNWREVARLVFSEGRNREAAARAKRRIASAYYRAEHQASREN